MERKYYIDNIRWITVVLVMVYHIIYMFNNSGVITNMDIKGIPQLDAFLVFVYPWFMCLLFVVSGISARYSLQKRTKGEFLKDRAKRILVPSIVGIFAYGWILGLVTMQYVDIFGGNGSVIPAPVKYIILCLMGTGPLWFARVLFIASLLLVIVKMIDKNDRFYNFCGRLPAFCLPLLMFLVWGSSLILNTPLITVYRWGIYLFMFFLGYFVFSHERILNATKKIAPFTSVIALALGAVSVILYYGSNYADDSVLQSFLTNAYLWAAILAILGLGKRFLNFRNKFTAYMTANNFSFYVLHYTVMLVIAYFTTTYIKLPFALYYIIIAAGTAVILPLITELLKRIPVIRAAILGIYKKK